MITVTLRNPLDKTDLLCYYIRPDDTPLAQDWQQALKQLLMSGALLEKNFCWLGWPDSARDLAYLCAELNRHIHTINRFNLTRQWQDAGLASYRIQEWFAPDVVMYGAEYEVSYGSPEGGDDDDKLGWRCKQEIMNRLHNHFEILQGTVWNLSPYYVHADTKTKYAIRQLNNICHEMENLILSTRKKHTVPEWIRPSQITTWIGAARYDLNDQHREVCRRNSYDRRFGHVYMHWTQIGKTLFEVWRDEKAPQLIVGDDVTDISFNSGAVCEAITSLRYYSGEFDIEWGQDVVANQGCSWHDDEQAAFRDWLIQNKLDPDCEALSLVYYPIGQVLLQESFGTTDMHEIWHQMSSHLDIYSIEIDNARAVYDYCWSDPDHEQQQISYLELGYKSQGTQS